MKKKTTPHPEPFYNLEIPVKKEITSASSEGETSDQLQNIPVPSITGSVFNPQLVVFMLEREDGPQCLHLVSTLALTDGWRKAVASHANDLSAEAQARLTGHASDGAPLQTAHVAFLPLAFVGGPRADGRVPGVALALPNSLTGNLRSEVLSAANRVADFGLKLGRLGAWKLIPQDETSPLKTLQPDVWTAYPEGATQWSTVTPVAFDHHPKSKDKAAHLAEIVAMIKNSCEHIGLPVPREVVVMSVSAHFGAPTAHEFPRLRRKDGSERLHTHAILIFDKPVCGPVTLGAGRYRGYGLCRPLEMFL
jgi:CRISPR-associated protein Csb2